MTVKLDVRGNSKDIQKDLQKLRRDEIPRATVTALNRTGNSVMSRTARITSRRTRVKAKSIRKRMPKTRASRRNMTFAFKTYSQGIPVHSQFTPAQLSTSLKTRKARVQGKQGVRWKGTTFQGSFVATPRRGGKSVVIKRKAKERYPTKTVTIDVRDTFDRVARHSTKLIGPKIFQKEFANATRLILMRRR